MSFIQLITDYPDRGEAGAWSLDQSAKGSEQGRTQDVRPGVDSRASKGNPQDMVAP